MCMPHGDISGWTGGREIEVVSSLSQVPLRCVFVALVNARQSANEPPKGRTIA